MMRLPHFDFRAPQTLEEAARILAGEGTDAMPLAGGTDLLPNMKRRQQVPKTLVSLRQVKALRQKEMGPAGWRLGACLTLAELVDHLPLRTGLTALWQAASQVATSQIRNQATLGGNICLDTRCNYYDQNYEWRKSIGFCLKRSGATCWVAPSSPKCLAVSSTDTAPALMALGARVRLVSSTDQREISLADLYENDGIHYMKKGTDEVLAEVLLDSMEGWKSTYWKLRRRGSFDFPVLSVAAAARFSKDCIVEEARIVVGAAASRPLIAEQAQRFLSGCYLNRETIAEAASLAARLAKPLDNTDFDMSWRKKVTAQFVTYALQELRGDALKEERKRWTHHSLLT